MYSFSMDPIIRGYHQYILYSDELLCEREIGNAHTVAIKKDIGGVVSRCQTAFFPLHWDGKKGSGEFLFYRSAVSAGC